MSRRTNIPREITTAAKISGSYDVSSAFAQAMVERDVVERDVNAVLAAANPTQLLSPRDLVAIIGTWKARAEAAEKERDELRAQRDKLVACLKEFMLYHARGEPSCLNCAKCDRARALLAEVRGK
jgi:hypothetical protein